MKTRLGDVDYYLPLYDEDGDRDPEAHYPEFRNSMIELGKLIEQDNPEDPSTQDRIETAIANLRDQLTTK